MANERNNESKKQSKIQERLQKDCNKVAYYCKLGRNDVNAVVSKAGRILDNIDSVFLNLFYLFVLCFVGFRVLFSVDEEKTNLLLSASFSELKTFGTDFFVINIGGSSVNMFILLIPACLLSFGLMYITKLLLHKSFVPAFRYLQILFGIIDTAMVVDLCLFLLSLTAITGDSSLSSLGLTFIEAFKSSSFLKEVLIISIPVCIIKYLFWGSSGWGYDCKFYCVKSRNFFRSAALKKVTKDLERLKARYSLPSDIPYNFSWKEKGEIRYVSNQAYTDAIEAHKEKAEAAAREKTEQERANAERRLSAAKERVAKIGTSHDPKYFIDHCRGEFKIASSGPDFDNLEAAYLLNITSPLETDYYLALKKNDMAAKERLLQQNLYYSELFGRYNIEDNLLLSKYNKNPYAEEQRIKEKQHQLAMEAYDREREQEEEERRREEEFMMEVELAYREDERERDEYYRSHPPIQ